MRNLPDCLGVSLAAPQMANVIPLGAWFRQAVQAGFHSIPVFYLFHPKVSILNDLGLNPVVLDVILTMKRILPVKLVGHPRGPYK